MRQLLVLLISTLTPILASAQGWPQKPIRMVIPYPPGGPTGVMGRLVATKLPELLGQPVIVDNKPGASGQMGAADVAKAAPDGYTFLTNASIHVINPHVYSKPLVDPIREFTPVALIGVVPLVMVVPPTQPAKDVKEFIAWARANPGKVNFASASSASAQHLAGEHFKQVTGIDMQHVPYNGSGPALADLVGGHVQLMFDSLPSSMSFIRSGKLKALGASSPKRLAVLPDVPTLIEAGIPDFEVSSWNGLFAPAGTPQPIIDRLAKATIPALHSPGIRQQFIDLGSVPVGSTPEEFKQYVHDEVIKWAEVAKAANVSID